jgi:hypothetical protein
MTVTPFRQWVGPAPDKMTIIIRETGDRNGGIDRLNRFIPTRSQMSASGPGCVETLTSGKCRKYYSPTSTTKTAYAISAAFHCNLTGKKPISSFYVHWTASIARAIMKREIFSSFAGSSISGSPQIPIPKCDVL